MPEDARGVVDSLGAASIPRSQRRGRVIARTAAFTQPMRGGRRHAAEDLAGQIGDFDLSRLDGTPPAPAEPDAETAAPAICPTCARVTADVLVRKTASIYRRAFSEVTLLDLLPPKLKAGETLHVLTAGDVDSLSFLKYVLRQQDLAHCVLSTWCMAMDDVQQIEEWLAARKIGRLDAYVGEIFPGTYAKEWTALCRIVRPRGGRVCVFRNHSKTFAGTGPVFDFGFSSSANVNTNPRTENHVLTTGRDVYEFYKAFYDGVTSFARDFDGWKPYAPPRQNYDR